MFVDIFKAIDVAYLIWYAEYLLHIKSVCGPFGVVLISYGMLM